MYNIINKTDNKGFISIKLNAEIFALLTSEYVTIKLSGILIAIIFFKFEKLINFIIFSLQSVTLFFKQSIAFKSVAINKGVTINSSTKNIKNITNR